MASEDEYTQAEVVRTLQRIEKDVAEVKADVRQQSTGYVSRAEFDTYKSAIGREVADLKIERAAARVPWTAVVAAVAAVATLVLTLIVLLGGKGSL